MYFSVINQIEFGWNQKQICRLHGSFRMLRFLRNFWRRCYGFVIDTDIKKIYKENLYCDYGLD